MDRDEAIRRAEIFLSYLREEKQYQFCAGDDPDTWVDLHPYQGQETYLVRFLDPFYQFRPKPKPLECWVWITPMMDAGQVKQKPTLVHFGEPKNRGMAGRWVLMREVTNETDD